MLVSANGKQAKFQFTRPRGARLHDAHKKEGAKCFNSRAHGGRDTYMQWVLRMCRSFNSRAHGGRDFIFFTFFSATGFNSRAHGGRDGPGGRRRGVVGCFNSRAHGGRDTILLRDKLGADWFQFTRPRGARPHRGDQGTYRAGFNSRAHGGRDVYYR